jgi:signal transduction histidine kinase
MVWKILESDAQDGTSSLNFYANPEDRANLLKDLNEKGKVEDREMQLKKFDGETVWATLTATYYRDENIIEGVMMDISKIKDNVEELQKANYELDNFVYHASHDLRSPLRSIMGLINLLRLEKTASGRENCLEMIEGSIKRLDNLVIDLLQISKGSRSGNSKEEISFVTEVNNSITNFCHVEDSDDIRIITKIYQPADFVSDLTRIRIILNNLISNAIKYRNANCEDSYVIVEAIVTETNAIITVEDNGEGIPAAKLSSIFDMFFRASENQQGSGLGLYIVKNVVEKLGGKIRVTSQEDRGTVFKVEIPNRYT